MQKFKMMTVSFILLKLIGNMTRLNAIKKFTNQYRILLGGNVYLANNSNLPYERDTAKAQRTSTFL